MFWALIVTKILQLQGDKVPLTPWTLCIHNFQAIISCLTSGAVATSLYAVVLLKVCFGGGGGAAKSSVNFVTGSWHPWLVHHRFLTCQIICGVKNVSIVIHAKGHKWLIVVQIVVQSSTFLRKSKLSVPFFLFKTFCL